MNTEQHNITNHFQQLYIPTKALMFYQHTNQEHDIYIEAFDCNKQGRLINAHPLSTNELFALADIFQRRHNAREKHLECAGLLPLNLLYCCAETNCAIWHTPPQRVALHFARTLAIKDGQMNIPGLIWKASHEELELFAVCCTDRPQVDTPLYHAPFFNLYEDGRVCMGTVKVNMKQCTDLYHFMQTWQAYFFNSKFSHLIGQHQSTRTPIKQLYKRLLQKDTVFVQTELMSTTKKLQDILP